MADNIWVAKQKKTAQVNTITPANVGIGNTFTVTINTKAITFTATAGTVANVTAGLVALLNASTEPEFAEITWADVTTALTGTMDTAGKPFTQTSSASGGTATLTTSTTTANTSPNDVNDALNWSAGTVPANTEDVYIDGRTQQSLLWNLSSLSAVTLTSLNIDQAFTGRIGLTEQDTDGTSYTQYRPTDLAISATTVNIGKGPGSGCGLLKLNVGTAQATFNVFNSGSASETNREAITLRGTHASNVLNHFGGSVGVAVLGGQTSTIATINCGPAASGAQQPTLRLGAGCTLTTVNLDGGTLQLNSACTTLNHKGGSTKITGSGAITTINETAGDISHQGTGTVTTWNLTGATADLGDQGPAITITNCKLFGNCSWKDRGYRGTYSNGLALQGGARLAGTPGGSVSIDIGPGRTLTPS